MTEQIRRYFYVDMQGQRQGPLELEQLRAAPITAQTQVWRYGLANWQPAGQIEELRDLYQRDAMPPSDSSVDDSPPAPPVVRTSTFTPLLPPPPKFSIFNPQMPRLGRWICLYALIVAPLLSTFSAGEIFYGDVTSQAISSTDAWFSIVLIAITEIVNLTMFSGGIYLRRGRRAGPILLIISICITVLVSIFAAGLIFMIWLAGLDTGWTSATAFDVFSFSLSVLSLLLEVWILIWLVMNRSRLRGAFRRMRREIPPTPRWITIPVLASAAIVLLTMPTYLLMKADHGANIPLSPVQKTPAVGLTKQQLPLATQTVLVEWHDGNPSNAVLTSGSAGVIDVVDGQLLLITNAHVLNLFSFEGLSDKKGTLGKYQVTVQFTAGKTAVVNAFGLISDGADLAVLVVPKAGLREGVDYAVLPLDQELSVQAGDEVVAIGNPLGQLPGTQTYGHVSAVRSETGPTGNLWEFIQTDTPLSRGNSGGPLMYLRNGSYYWVGINTASATEGQNLNFAYRAITLSDDQVVPYEANAAGATKAFNDFCVAPTPTP